MGKVGFGSIGYWCVALESKNSSLTNRNEHIPRSFEGGFLHMTQPGCIASFHSP